jgi:hypothetical protein
MVVWVYHGYEHKYKTVRVSSPPLVKKGIKNGVYIFVNNQ